MVLEFEAELKNGVIRVPEDISSKVTEGTVVHVSISPLSIDSSLTPDTAWELFLTFINQRMKQVRAPESYNWRREDAYDHIR